MKSFGEKLFALAILLPTLLISCTKSGALTGGTGASSSFGSLNGSVNGGLSGVANATINLLIAGNSTPVATATTASDGSFNLVFTNPGGNYLLYLQVTGGTAGGETNSNSQFLSIAGTSAAPLSSLRINELTTAATEFEAFNFGILADTNGSITLNAPVNTVETTNIITQYNNLIAGGNLNTGNVNLGTSTQNGLKTMANDFAVCIETPSKCSNLFSAALNSSGTAASNVLEAGLNMLNNSTNNASSLYTLAFPLNASTGFNLTSASMPGGFTFNNVLANASNTFGAGSVPFYIAIDASGNLWIPNFVVGGHNVVELSSTGSLLGTFNDGGTRPGFDAIDAAGNIWVTNIQSNNVTELNSSGSVLGTFSVGTTPFETAIDSSGNVWVVNDGSNNVTELNSSGTLIGTYSVGSAPYGIAIDSSGNAWVDNESGNTVTELNSVGTTLNTVTGLSEPIGINIDPSGNIWVMNGNVTTVTKLNRGGTTLGTFTVGTSPFLEAIDSSGNVWMGIDGASSTLTELTPNGIVAANYPIASGSSPRGIAIDRQGDLWVTNRINNTVVEYLGLTAANQFFPYSGPQFP